MASSVWNSVQANVPGAPSGMTSVSSSDPASLFNTHLASALSTMGDAQYWEESISPTTIRTSLASSDPSNPNSTPTLLRGMKWLLACISKGRNVSDFYPHVVKLVGAPSLEVRKMVYMYLVQYADHDNVTRELSLLSINSFQRGLADSEQLIRALALRVLSSIRVSDVLQIQILGVQKCAKDKSPYVRKCAANALAKLSPRCDDAQREMLLEIMTNLLDDDTSTMVLTSTIVAFAELCPGRLELLHSSFRKVCHLLTDMDEWGQVVVIDTMARYCRKFFRKPRTAGSAEAIDRERRVRRTVSGICASVPVEDVGLDAMVESNGLSEEKPKRRVAAPKKIKRRVVKKGFYSDEEDESTDEEVYVEEAVGTSLTLAGVLRDRNAGGGMVGGVNMAADEDDQLHEDHRLLLRSSLPLLKSRNSGVVLAVCSLHYYCGVASVKVRSALGKALVRIHRDRREIQYVVLTSIRTLVAECPSAFTPFLNDFFITAMDPSYTRMIKLDILTSLALEPASIEAVLKELRTYIRHDDKVFVCASIRAVGRVVELARIVYDRHGEKTGDSDRSRKEANRIAINCLFGLMALTQACDYEIVVGECAIVMQRIIVMLVSDSSGMSITVDDPNHLQEMAMKRMVLLLVKSLTSRSNDQVEANDDEGDDDDEEKVVTDLDILTVSLPPAAVASALWIVGEWITSLSTTPTLIHKMHGKTKLKMRLELIRLAAKSFPNLEPIEKLEAVHLASKLRISAAAGADSARSEAAVCENVLSMGRVDVNVDVRDRARFESAIVHLAVGLKHDTDAMTNLPSVGRKMTVDKAKAMLLRPKPSSSSLPLEDEEEKDSSTEVNGPFRFGTLSSLVSHRARTAYLPLPAWAETDSPASLRDPPSPSATHAEEVDYGWKVGKNANGGFYDSAGDSGTSSSSASSSDESEGDSSSGEESTSSEDNSEDDTSESDSDDSSESDVPPAKPPIHQNLPAPSLVNGGPTLMPTPVTQALVDNPSSDESSGEESASDLDESDDTDVSEKPEGSLLLPMETVPQPMMQRAEKSMNSTNGSSLVSGLEGLVMAPVVIDVEEKADPDIEKDSGAWMQLVRPELGGGLMVTARYLRGPTREREAKLIGLDPESVTTVCLQVKFENKRTDAGILRRVRIIQRSNTSGSIGTRHVVAPQEIVTLKKGQLTTATLGMNFQSASDRDGALQARFDFKSDRGSNPVDIRPSLGELLRPCHMSQKDFESKITALQGFQRVVSSFQLPADSISTAHAALPQSIMKHAALTPVGKKVAWKDNKFRLAGILPASSDKIYVAVECDSKSGAGSITVCCEHPLACNSLKDLLKPAVMN